jgi:aspartate aminotransferase
MLSAEPHFSDRLAKVSESRTTRIATLAQTLRQQGRDIISLAVGEPDFATPAPIIEATQRALDDQRTRYGPVPGEAALRERLAEAFAPCGYDHNNILVTNGAKQALFSLFQVLCDPGDEVIIPRPCWVSFTEQIKLAGGCPVLVDTAADFQLDPQRIAQAVTGRTRAILVNSPNNPTGAVYEKAALAETARVASERGLYLISDEAYHAFTYDGRSHQSALESAPDPQRVITVRSFSKHFNMTGFRLGYVAGGAKLIQSLARLQSHLTGNVCTFAQYGALAALQMDSSVVDKRRAILQKRRDMAYALARERFTCVRAAGAFYLFPDVRSHLRDGETSEDLAARLLNEAGVAVVPGEAFHGPGHIRISFGMSEADLQRAFEKIKEVL